MKRFGLLFAVAACTVVVVGCDSSTPTSNREIAPDAGPSAAQTSVKKDGSSQTEKSQIEVSKKVAKTRKDL